MTAELSLDEYKHEIEKAKEFIRKYDLWHATVYAARLPAGSWKRWVWMTELGNIPEVTSHEELERLRTLACPHIKNSPFWEDFVSHHVLACTNCRESRPGEFSEHRQPKLI